MYGISLIWKPFNFLMTEQETTQHSKTGKRRSTWIYLGIIGILLATNVLFFFKKEKVQKTVQVIEAKVAQKDTAIVALQSEYNASLVRLDDLVGRNAALDRQLQDKTSELNTAKSKIEVLLSKEKLTEQELTEAKILIQKLNTSIASYESQIKALKKENKQLIKQRDSVSATVKGLEQKIDIGKMLQATNIRLKGLRISHGGNKELETEKAKRVDVLRVFFDLAPNKLVEGGQKELHICIINPNDELISNAGLGSGSFNLADGSTKYFSMSKSVDLVPGQGEKNISVDWKQSGNYAKGIYTVEIYHKGYLLGKGSVSLR